MTAATAQVSLKAKRRDWIALAVIALPCMVYSMDLTVLNLALPELMADLRPTASEMLWIIDIYGFMVAGLLLIMGSFGDRIGRRKLLLIGAFAFGVASIFAAFATSPEMLILARALLGIAGATLAPSTLSLISNIFRDPDERTFAIGVWVSSFSAGAVVGPLVGGVLIQYFWWGSVFLAAVPVMLLLVVLGRSLLPEFRDPNPGPLDILSALLSLAAVLSFIYGVKRIAEAGFEWPPVLIMLAGVLLAVIFVRRQGRLSTPLVDVRLFEARVFNTALAINVLGVFFTFGAYIFLAQYFQFVIGLTPLEAGLWSMPSGIAFFLASFLTPALSRHMRPAYLMAGGLLVAGVGFAALAVADGLMQVVAASIVFFVGFTPVITLTTNVIVSAAPPEQAGAASALSETASELGGALGIALLGSLSTAIYRSRMADLVPGSLPEDLLRSARSTIGGAVEAARLLPTEASSSMLAAAREAFILGLQVTAVLGAVGMVVGAALTVAVLRDVEGSPDQGHG